MTSDQTGGASAKFFDAHQRATIEAAMARIIPTDDQAGAKEAGTVEFVDRYLSGLEFIYAKPDGSGFESSRASELKLGSSASRSSARNMSRVSRNWIAGASPGLPRILCSLRPSNRTASCMIWSGLRFRLRRK